MSTIAAPTRGYHHGELKTALVAATDAILRETGIEGFTLREAARRAGVSPGAPSHHFGNATGLLTEVAILAYGELEAYLATANSDGAPEATLRALASAYVRFALDHPGRFRLMFRKDLIDRSNTRYGEASSRALIPFAQAAARARDTDLATARRTGSIEGILASWSTVHGIAQLALEDKFAALPDGSGTAFTDELLPRILLAQWPDQASSRS
jgi:AcrR family transcriptional regulator